MYCDELDASAGCLSIRCRYNAVHAASEQFNSRIPSDTAKARGLHTVALTRLVRDRNVRYPDLQCPLFEALD